MTPANGAPIRIASAVSPRWRLALAAVVVGLGLLAALLIGSPIAGCLGPLGVTAIECAKTTGVLPTVGVGLPVLAGSVLLALLVARPDVVRPGTLTAIAAGAIMAGGGYILLRPALWTAPTSTGSVVTLTLPLDGSAVALAAILGGLAGLAVSLIVDHAATMRSAG